MPQDLYTQTDLVDFQIRYSCALCRRKKSASDFDKVCGLRKDGESMCRSCFNSTIDEIITLSDVGRFVYYDESSPSCLRWANNLYFKDKNDLKKSSKIRKNDVAGRPEGRRKNTWMLSFRKTNFKVQDVVWALHNRPLVPGFEVGFLNDNKTDFKIMNLVLDEVLLPLNKEPLQRTNSEKDKIKRKLITSARERAKKGALPCTIQLGDFEIPAICPILGIPLVRNVSRVRNDSISLDRIDPLNGYVKGNVQVISHLANSMKNSATKQQLLMFAKWVINEYN